MENYNALGLLKNKILTIQLEDFMKKYFLISSFFALAIPTMAMDGEKQPESGDIKAAVARLPETIDPKKIEAEVKSNPQNYELKGGIGWGLLSEKTLKEEALLEQLHTVSAQYNELQGYFKTLVGQLEATQKGLNQLHSVTRALQETQEKLDLYQKTNEESQLELKIQERLRQELQRQQDQLLAESAKKEATVLFEQARTKRLQEIIQELQGITAEFVKIATEIDKLVGENTNYGKILSDLEKTIQDPNNLNSVDDIKKQRDFLTKRIDENLEKISKLQKDKENLEKSRIEKEILKGKLETAIKENNYYDLIKEKILDQHTNDDDLALFIFSSIQVCGMDLDQLSEGKEERLIEILIYVSRPKQSMPWDINPEPYKNRFRFLGNSFVPGGLAWKGEKINLKDCTYSKSAFKTNSGDMARLIKQKLAR